ncbi:hypothetical protein JCM8208_004356 [Rhodotorula glutinis]
MDQHTTSIEHAALPTPHRALDPSRPALLPRLIDDVLLAILDELAAPEFTDELAAPEFTDQGYEARQQTLRSVCLASRRLCALARPFLRRQIVVSRDGQMERLQQTGSLGMRTRGPMQLSWLQAYTNLRRLELVKITPIALNLGHHLSPFPHLELLIFSKCDFLPSNTAQWLKSAWLPRLKTLVVQSSWSSKLPTALAPCLAKQLEVIQVDELSRDRRDKQWASSTLPAVLIANPDFLGPGVCLPRHGMYGFYQILDRSAILRRQMIQCLKGHVDREPRAAPDAGTVLLLPSQVLDANQDEPASALDRDKDVEAIHAFEDLCRERGRRLIWYDEQELRASGEFIPLEFVRYARELKARSLGGSASSSG